MWTVCLRKQQRGVRIFGISIRATRPPSFWPHIGHGTRFTCGKTARPGFSDLPKKFLVHMKSARPDVRTSWCIAPAFPILAFSGTCSEMGSGESRVVLFGHRVLKSARRAHASRQGPTTLRDPTSVDPESLRAASKPRTASAHAPYIHR